MSHVALGSPAQTAVVGIPPDTQSFTGPNPEACSDTNKQRAKVFDKEEDERRSDHMIISTRTTDAITQPRFLSRFTFLLLPAQHPLIVMLLLVYQTTNDDPRRHGIQETEDSNSHHKACHLVSFGAAVFDDSADTEETHEAHEEEDGAQYEVEEERR